MDDAGEVVCGGRLGHAGQRIPAACRGADRGVDPASGAALGSARGEALVRSSRGLRSACSHAPAPAQAQIPDSLKSSCAPRTPQPGYTFEFCDDGNTPVVRPHAERRRRQRRPRAGEVRRLRGPAGEGRGRDQRAGRRPGRQHRARRRHLASRRVPAPPGGYPLIVVHARLLRRQQDAPGRRPTSTPPASTGTTTTPGSPSRGYVVVNYTSRGFRNQGGRRRLDRRDAARLAPLRDQRLPAPRRPGRRRPVLQREPAEGGADRRLLRRRLRLDGAHRPELDEPRRQGHEARRVGAAVRLDRPRLLAGPERAPLPVPGRPAGVRRLGLDRRRSASRSRASTRSCTAPGQFGATFPPVDRRGVRAACSRAEPVRDQPALRRTRSRTPCPSSSTTAPPTTRTTSSRGSRPTRATGSRSSTPPRFTDPLFTPVENLRMSNRIQRDRARATRSSSTSATTSTSSRTRRRSGATSAAPTTTCARSPTTRAAT